MSSKKNETVTKDPSRPALVPKLRFPEFEGEWEEKQLDTVCSKITQGGTPDTSVSEYWGGEVFWITPSEMGKSYSPYVGRTIRTLTKRGLNDCASELLPPNSVILSVRAPIGHLAINTVPMAVNQGCKGLIVGPALDAFFLYSALLLAKSHLMDLGAGNTFKELSSSVLKSLRVPVPTLPEQQRIADCLSSLDDLIDAQAQKVDALKTHKKGLMQQLFPREGEKQPRLRFPEFEGEWEQTTLCRVASFSSGGTPSKENPEYWNGTIPWVSASSMYEVTVEKADHYVTPVAIGNGTRIAKRGSILILVRGSMLFKRVPICIAGVDVAFNQDVKALDVDASVDNYFLIYQLIAFQARFLINETGIGAGKIELDQLRDFELFIPDAPEQQRIASCLASLDELITNESNKLDVYKTHKKGLMQQLFPSIQEN